MKNFYVDNLRDGVRIEDVFLVCNKNVGKTQDGSTFIRLKLSDRTGAIDAIKWDAPDAMCSSLAVDDYVSIRGVVSKYKDKLQIVLEGVRKCCDKVDPADFLPRTPKDIPQMISDLKGIISTVEHPQLRALLNYFFNDEEFVAKFSSAPAAMRIHHAYIGGLLEHSLSVAQMCDMVAGHYPEINRDLLLTAAILHDVGKIDEFCWSRSIHYTDSGHLVGHLVSGAMTVDAAVGKIGDFHPLLRLILTHMILSHHGEKEFGSPKRPKSLESVTLHYVEDLDAKIKTFTEAVNHGDGRVAESDLWTERHWLFDRPLLKGLPDCVLGNLAERPAESAPDSEDSSPDLFTD
ncbi:MAG: HD domain-containing protein [Armatimonadota bacterium]|nr:HD domain-containing protein [Armatimonadota bacterium]